MFTLLPYTVTTAGATVDGDMNFVTDAEFTGRNNHLLLTEDYQLLCVAMFGPTLTRANVQVPFFNQYTRWNIYPLMRSAIVPSPPQVMWLDQFPVMLPRFEEITIKETDTAVDTVTTFLWLAKPPFNINLPPSQLPFPLVARATAAVTLVANGWSALAPLGFEQTLKGGTYSVIGCVVQVTNGLAFRLVFPRPFVAGSRKMRPGWLCQNAISDLLEDRPQRNPYFLGEFGRFWTVELPQIEIYGSAAGAQVAEARLWLAKISDSDAGLPG